jgi:hypothetical protein
MQLITRKFNVDEYHIMVEVGILKPNYRVELIQYETQIPQPQDIYLLIEVSDSTIKYDQELTSTRAVERRGFQRSLFGFPLSPSQLT